MCVCVSYEDPASSSLSWMNVKLESSHPAASCTSCFSLIQRYCAVSQTSQEEHLGVFDAEDWAAVRGHEGQQALDRRVHATVHQDATKTSTEHSHISKPDSIKQ